MQHVNALSKTMEDLKINASLIWNMDESMVDVSSETATKVVTLAEATKTYARAATPPNHTLIGTIWSTFYMIYALLVLTALSLTMLESLPSFCLDKRLFLQSVLSLKQTQRKWLNPPMAGRWVNVNTIKLLICPESLSQFRLANHYAPGFMTTLSLQFMPSTDNSICPQMNPLLLLPTAMCQDLKTWCWSIETPQHFPVPAPLPHIPSDSASGFKDIRHNQEVNSHNCSHHPFLKVLQRLPTIAAARWRHVWELSMLLLTPITSIKLSLLLVWWYAEPRMKSQSTRLVLLPTCRILIGPSVYLSVLLPDQLYTHVWSTHPQLSSNFK